MDSAKLSGELLAIVRRLRQMATKANSIEMQVSTLDGENEEVSDMILEAAEMLFQLALHLGQEAHDEALESYVERKEGSTYAQIRH